MKTHQNVAAEIRAEFARRRISGRQAAKQLGWTGPYLSRRLTGAVPFDVNDLAAIAELLDVPVSTFFQVRGGVMIPRVSALPGYRALGAAA